jgi:hypothetical protein
MALSERERKVLEELERELYASDSGFASKMGGSQQKLAAGRASSPKRIVAGVVVILIGLTEILASLVMRYPAFAVVGFGLMVLGLSLATGQFGRQSRLAKGGDKQSSAKKPAASGDLKSKLEERWDRRAGE